MSGLVGKLAISAAMILGIPALALFAYDRQAVRPHLPRVDALLAEADPLDASPPPIFRRLIDADAGSPDAFATRLVTSELFPERESQGRTHLRNALWDILLPMHMGEEKMYGLVATLAYNGEDRGFSRYASREYGQPLDALSPEQAAMTVAITRAPSTYRRHPDRLAQRAAVLLADANIAID